LLTLKQNLEPYYDKCGGKWYGRFNWYGCNPQVKDNASQGKYSLSDGFFEAAGTVTYDRNMDRSLAPRVDRVGGKNKTNRKIKYIVNSVKNTKRYKNKRKCFSRNQTIKQKQKKKILRK